MKNAIIYSLLVASLFSCEKNEHTTYRIFVSNHDSVDYQLQYQYKDIIIDTFLTAYAYNNVELIDLSLNRGIEDQVLPAYTKEEFLEEVQTLKVFRMVGGDTVYYGGSVDYCLNKDNWDYHYAEDYVYAIHEYALRLGKD
tara:strand:+ start:1203 stop:1622 length:420 start_codon:yes stop_codon:yes gene_type:complete